ncbi:MAG TPA: PilZ domain-containing protein [Syntrophomonadaceae bacterium]|nr:PilZ domain-containing protein [Syntrophomonadaceae bacterium]
MDKKLLKINKLVDITVERETPSGKLVQETFASRIEDIDRKHLYLAYPLKNGAPFPVRNNEIVTLKFLYKDDLYECTVKALASLTSPIILLKTTKPEKFVRIQLRNWVRHPCHTLVEFKIIDNGKGGQDTESPTYQEYSIDISGGGMLLHTKQTLDAGTMLYVEFNLDDCLITANSRVVRSAPIDNDFRTAVEFVDIKEKEREKIVSYIFRKQREILKKRLL